MAGNHRVRAILFLTVLFVCGYFLFFHGLADRDLWSSHEARAAQDAQSILDEGSFGLPHLFDRRADLQKPPLYYWLVACIARYTGENQVDAWSVRLPAALSGAATAVLLGLFGARRVRSTAGLIAATTLATAFHFTWLARIGRIDMPLTFSVSLAVGSFYLAQGGTRAFGWLLVAYLSVAASVMLKGPIGLVLPLIVAVAHLLSERRLPPPWQVRACLRLCHEFGLWWGVTLVVGLTVPWFIWANSTTGGEFFRVFFWKHNLDRGFGSEGTLAAHPWWFYGPRFAFDFLPWSLVLPVLAWLSWRGRLWCDDPEARFGAVWCLAVIGFLSCMRFKRADYLLPAYPGAALFLGCTLERWMRQQVARVNELKRLEFWGSSDPLARRASEGGLLARRANRCYTRLQTALSFGSTKIQLSACSVLVAAAVGWLIYVDQVLPHQEPAHECRRFAAAIRQHAPAPNLVLFFRTENHALAFHVGRPIDTLLEWENLDWWAGQPEPYHVVMPVENAAEWADHLAAGELEEVLRTTDLPGCVTERPLVLLRSLPRAGLTSPAESRADVRQ